jgi:hypothetical protein
VKARGREYLRIIYRPEYTIPENIERLRERSLSHKRSLTLREFALAGEREAGWRRSQLVLVIDGCQMSYGQRPYRDLANSPAARTMHSLQM